MYKYVIFDMDGTITDSLDDITVSVNVMLRKNGFPERTRDEIRSFVGNGIPKLVERSLPDGKKDLESVAARTKEMLGHYLVHNADRTRPYDGIPELMEKLRDNGIATAVVTNKEQPAAENLMRVLFPAFRGTVIGARPGIRPKPNPDGVCEAMKEMGIENKNEAVYMGDSDVDVMTAKNAGLDCIGVEWGFRDRPVLEQAGADFIVSTPEEAAEIILGGKDTTV